MLYFHYVQVSSTVENIKINDFFLRRESVATPGILFEVKVFVLSGQFGSVGHNPVIDALKNIQILSSAYFLFFLERYEW